MTHITAPLYDNSTINPSLLKNYQADISLHVTQELMSYITVQNDKISLNFVIHIQNIEKPYHAKMKL